MAGLAGSLMRVLVGFSAGINCPVRNSSLVALWYHLVDVGEWPLVIGADLRV